MISAQDDLMQELEDLEQEALEETLLDVGPIADKLPSVPSAQPVAATRGLFKLILSCSYHIVELDNFQFGVILRESEPKVNK